MLRPLLIASVLQLGLATGAMACAGQTGAVIFDDTFPDDSGGWEFTVGSAEVVPPVLKLTPNGTISTLNLTFNAVNGDYCAEVKLPQAKPDNYVGFGLDFWAKDYTNLMSFIVYTNKTAGLYKLTDGAWTSIYTGTDINVDTTPGATNTVRVIAKDGKITLMLNDTKLKVVRAQIPEGNLRFGAYAEIQTNIANGPSVEVTSYSVTTGE